MQRTADSLYALALERANIISNSRGRRPCVSLGQEN